MVAMRLDGIAGASVVKLAYSGLVICGLSLGVIEVWTGGQLGRAFNAFTISASMVSRHRISTCRLRWPCAWTHVIPVFAFPPEARRVICTTNALESVHARLRW